MITSIKGNHVDSFSNNNIFTTTIKTTSLLAPAITTVANHHMSKIGLEGPNSLEGPLLCE
jgi:hypothetical protein